MRLPDLLAVSRGRYCGRKGLSDETFGRLLESAHSALDIIAATIRSRELRFTVTEIRTRTLYSAMGGITSADTTTLPLLAWPVQSIDPDSLRVFGFSREVRPGDPATRVYYGPDPRVLFADWFLDGHCFSLAHFKAGDDTLHVRFVPARKDKLVDISGELLLDAHHLALLQFSVHPPEPPRLGDAERGRWRHALRAVAVGAVDGGDLGDLGADRRVADVVARPGNGGHHGDPWQGGGGRAGERQHAGAGGRRLSGESGESGGVAARKSVPRAPKRRKRMGKAFD